MEVVGAMPMFAHLSSSMAQAVGAATEGQQSSKRVRGYRYASGIIIVNGMLIIGRLAWIVRIG
jgi:hypothetical protein